MKEIDYKYYKELNARELSFSKLPAGMVKSPAFRNLEEAHIISIVKTGRGKTVKVINQLSYDKFLTTHFPENVAGTSRAANISRLRNSKAGKREGSNISFLRGTGQITVNGNPVDLGEHTRKYGLFSAYNPSLVIDKLCIIENLETFLNAEQVLDNSYTYLHKYGRIGKDFLNKIQGREVLVFSDYDLIGLGEYLTVKEAFPNATFYVPENFTALFEKYATPLPDKQVAAGKVKNSTEKIVVQIRKMVLKSNRFLEQEILLLVK